MSKNKLIEKLESQEKAKSKKQIPSFKAGDTLKVYNKVTEREGTKVRERLQVFQGVCIARRSAGVNSSFTVRKISFGEGVEKVFPLYSPIVDKIEIVQVGKVARGKLYYLRDRRGKAARIAEDFRAKNKAKAKVSVPTEGKAEKAQTEEAAAE